MKSLSELIRDASKDPSLAKIERLGVLLVLTVTWWFLAGGYDEWQEKQTEEQNKSDRDRDQDSVVNDTNQIASDADSAASDIGSL